VCDGLFAPRSKHGMLQLDAEALAALDMGMGWERCVHSACTARERTSFMCKLLVAGVVRHV